MRCVMTRVLPEPAPARRSTAPSTEVMPSRCCGFIFARRSGTPFILVCDECANRSDEYRQHYVNSRNHLPSRAYRRVRVVFGSMAGCLRTELSMFREEVES